MSMYNTVTTKAACPFCGQKNMFCIQFKYGDCWLHEYKLGDVLIWDRNNIGLPGVHKVSVEANGGPCPNCGRDFMCNLIIESDQITELIPLAQDLFFTDPGYVVIEE